MGDTDNGDVILETATSIWADDLKQSYIKKMKSKHSSEAFPLPSTYTPVNEWIEEETNGLIRDFIQPVSPGPLGPTLVSTVYFNGTWSDQFDPDDTVDGYFTLRDGTEKKGRFMSDTRFVQVLDESSELGGASAILLDYGKEDPPEYSSLFILPKDDSMESLESVLTGLSSELLSDLDDLPYDRADIKLPRFKIEWSASLKKELQHMGIKAAFDVNIDNKFDRMTTNDALTVGDVIHGASMSVTELGTQAGAVTVVEMRAGARISGQPLDMNFNRPFVTAIIHRPTGTPIFIGKVDNPQLILEDPQVIHPYPQVIHH